MKHLPNKATPTMNPQPDQSKDTIRFPMKAAVHAPVMPVVTLKTKSNFLSLRMTIDCIKPPFYPTTN